ncbi:MAG: AAA family ATPase, partial [Proteobacteria bacterium]|nr:AAA family ATPase [Pseudomonadota bacterium]
MTATEPATQTFDTEPFYAAQGDEVALFEAAWRNQLPVLLKGP